VNNLALVVTLPWVQQASVGPYSTQTRALWLRPT
jgi:hypothetical protein